ncbi:hypothetical protein [Streptomyces sp. NPDC005549]|uniref:hypothetical protein n=1 Tax=Streptomyces sp. NPDC005549 TaxID=3154888 RepID=UPI0033A8A42D
MASLTAMSSASPRVEIPENSVVSREAHEHTASQAPAVSDEVKVLALVKAALSWDVESLAVTGEEDALDMARQFTDYSWIVAAALETRILSLPADSDLYIRARATLGEANRRLQLGPLSQSASSQSAGKRAQNLARLVQSASPLNRSPVATGRWVHHLAPGPNGRLGAGGTAWRGVVARRLLLHRTDQEREEERQCHVVCTP